VAFFWPFRVGDPVWAKMKGFSPWPGKVCLPPTDCKRPAGLLLGFGDIQI